MGSKWESTREIRTVGWIGKRDGVTEGMAGKIEGREWENTRWKMKLRKMIIERNWWE